MNVLIVDDEVMIRDILEEALKSFKHNVTIAVDGREGLNAICQNPDFYDLIITDLKMPYTNGLELCDKLKQSGIEIPVILMTGHAHIDHNKDDFLGVLYKPFGLKDLIDLMAKVKVSVV